MKSERVVASGDRRAYMNIDSLAVNDGMVGWAAGYSRRLLGTKGKRWLHTLGVAQKAERVAAVLQPREGEILIAAAYLHDIGYAPALVITGFHPLDGADHLRSHDTPLKTNRIASLVANHTGATYEAEQRGLSELMEPYPKEKSDVSRALSYCDITTGPDGKDVTLDDRLDEVEQRYGSEHLVVKALAVARAELTYCVEEMEKKLVNDREKWSNKQ